MKEKRWSSFTRLIFHHYGTENTGRRNSGRFFPAARSRRSKENANNPSNEDMRWIWKARKSGICITKNAN